MAVEWMEFVMALSADVNGNERTAENRQPLLDVPGRPIRRPTPDLIGSRQFIGYID
jgi:hypothetical protein